MQLADLLPPTADLIAANGAAVVPAKYYPVQPPQQRNGRSRTQDLGQVSIGMAIRPRVYALSRPRPVPSSRGEAHDRSVPIFHFHVRLISGTGFPRFKNSLPDPVVYLNFPGAGRPRKSTICQSTTNPVWNEMEEHSFAVTPANIRANLTGMVYDRNVLTENELLGTFEIPCSEMQVEVAVVDVRLQSARGVMATDPNPKIRVMLVREQATYSLQPEDGNGLAGPAVRGSPAEAAAAAASGGGVPLTEDGLRVPIVELVAALAAAAGGGQSRMKAVETIRRVADICYEPTAEHNRRDFRLVSECRR